MPESSTTAKLSPGITSPISSPVVPEGEDSHSFKRHCKFIQQEYKGKKNPNMTVVDNLAEMSFAMRWQDLHSNAYSIENVFEKYPFLESSTQVSYRIAVKFGNQLIELRHTTIFHLSTFNKKKFGSLMYFQGFVLFPPPTSTHTNLKSFHLSCETFPPSHLFF